MKVNFEGIIKTLKIIQESPKFFVLDEDVKEIETFVYGFLLGCYISHPEIDLRTQYFYFKRKVSTKMKLKLGTRSTVDVLRESGLTDDKVHKDFLDMEIEIWRRLAKHFEES